MYTRKTLARAIAMVLSAPLTLAWAEGGCPVVDTGQDACFDDSTQISCPEAGEGWFGQDAQYAGNQPVYRIAADGLTVHDQVTGLTWQRSADVDGDGAIDAADKFTWSGLPAYVAQVNAQGFGGYSDWRLPTIKELYSLMDFRGTDPNVQSTDVTGLVPFIDTGYFAFGYGDTTAGERVIDSQWATSTLYVADSNMMFGVNFADGRIKGYGMTSPDPQQGEKTFYVRLVRGNAYGGNDFADNGDGTVTDRATGLTWMRQDGMEGMVWQGALDFCNDAVVGGYEDWRLPNAKELQSILDYTRSPDTTGSAAIDPVFDATPIINEDGAVDYPYYWSSTTHIRVGNQGDSAAYLAFGRGLGEMNGAIVDVHGAGCQRSDPKYGNADEYPQSMGPQGDIRRVFNYARCVRGGVAGGIFTGGGESGTGGSDPGGEEPLQDGCSGLSAGDSCILSDTESGICRTGPAGLRCAPAFGSTGFGQSGQGRPGRR